MTAVPDDVHLDLADARRQLVDAERIASLASALVSHGDAAGFDASVFEDCSPGFQRDFHALRRAVAARPVVQPSQQAWEGEKIGSRRLRLISEAEAEYRRQVDRINRITDDEIEAAERQRLRATEKENTNDKD